MGKFVEGCSSSRSSWPWSLGSKEVGVEQVGLEKDSETWKAKLSVKFAASSSNSTSTLVLQADTACVRVIHSSQTGTPAAVWYNVLLDKLLAYSAKILEILLTSSEKVYALLNCKHARLMQYIHSQKKLDLRALVLLLDLSVSILYLFVI